MSDYTSITEDGEFIYEDVPENYLKVLAEIRAELGKQRLEKDDE